MKFSLISSALGQGAVAATVLRRYPLSLSGVEILRRKYAYAKAV